MKNCTVDIVMFFSLSQDLQHLQSQGKPGQAKPNQVKPNQVEPSQTKRIELLIIFNRLLISFGIYIKYNIQICFFRI